jgi:hypothetical protein
VNPIVVFLVAVVCLSGCAPTASSLASPPRCASFEVCDHFYQPKHGRDAALGLEGPGP